MAAPACYLLSFLEQLAQGMLHLPEAVWVGGRPSLLALFVYYAVLALFCVLAVQRQKKVRRRGCLWLLGIPLALFFLLRSAPQQMEILCMDVGQGDGALLRMPDGAVFLIDGGSSSEQELWERQIGQSLKYYGIRTVDAVFLSHADLDHMSGILEFLQAYEPGLSGKNVHGITLEHAHPAADSRPGGFSEAEHARRAKGDCSQPDGAGDDGWQCQLAVYCTVTALRGC